MGNVYENLDCKSNQYTVHVGLHKLLPHKKACYSISEKAGAIIF
jgi:hypothetical protein